MPQTRHIRAIQAVLLVLIVLFAIGSHVLESRMPSPATRAASGD